MPDQIIDTQPLYRQVHEHGFVRVVDVMPRVVPEGRTADYAIVEAARVSYGQGLKTPEQDEALLRYMMRHKHWSPFEMCEIKWHVALPLFVARQWVRHRTASISEVSARYTVLPDRFYVPAAEDVKAQSTKNRQGRDGELSAEQVAAFRDWLESGSNTAYDDYTHYTEAGVSRELARLGLPTNVYTQWYWKCDLRNTLNFLQLRMDSHAQKEIRDYANAMYDLTATIFPQTMRAFRDFCLNTLTLTALDVQVIRTMLGEDATARTVEFSFPTEREADECRAKLLLLLGPQAKDSLMPSKPNPTPSSASST